MEKNYEFYGTVAYRGEWVLIECPLSVVNYYRFWVEKFIGKKTSTSYHKPHITVVAGKYDKGCDKKSEWMKYEGQRVKVTYEPKIYTDNEWMMLGEYFWLRVECPLIPVIRTELGLKPYPYHRPHLTICYRGY